MTDKLDKQKRQDVDIEEEEAATVFSSKKAEQEERPTVFSHNQSPNEEASIAYLNEEDETVISNCGQTDNTADSKGGNKEISSSKKNKTDVKLLLLHFVGNNPLISDGHRIEIKLTIEPFVVGREDRQRSLPQCDYAFNAEIQNISRKHAAFIIRDDVPCVCDLRSVNGTFLNGIKLEPNHYYYIKSEDIIAFSSKGIEYRVKYM